ncbi:MAG: TlpA family protein disulfide reductase [Acidobacteriota bacterium]|nr:TlpA family protein disulfide reductase [Acidobacteriota bacterium]MDH3783790.1 TlpA family protein disulfide reductase [Acidobacteriota bacterium]
MTQKRRIGLGFALFLLLSLPLSAGVVMEPTNPPDWHISEWINGDPGPLRQQRDKVVIIEFFQMWCPACNQFSLPLMQRWEEKYGRRSDVLLVSIHTVFEGHDVQTPERLKAFVQEKGIRRPVGIDGYEIIDPEMPVTMKRFKTQGTPQIVIIGKDGKRVFDHFGIFNARSIEGFIDRLLRDVEEDSVGQYPTMKDDDRVRPPAVDPMSGRYRLELQQVANTCALPALPQQLDLVIEIKGNNMRATFGTGYLGVKELTLDYNAATQGFNLDSRDQKQDGDQELIVQLEIKGRVFGDNPTEMQFTAILNQGGPGAGPECLVELQGYGQKLGR